MHLLLHYQMIINNTSPTLGYSHLRWRHSEFSDHGHCHHCPFMVLLDMHTQPPQTFLLLEAFFTWSFIAPHLWFVWFMILSWYYIILWHRFSCLYQWLNAVRNSKQINDMITSIFIASLTSMADKLCQLIKPLYRMSAQFCNMTWHQK